MSTPVKTIDEILIGTKYEGAKLCVIPNMTRTFYGPNPAYEALLRDCEVNAALASLLPAAVKALEAVETSLVYYRNGGAKANGILKTERDAVVTALEDLMKWQVTPTLTRISEATKAVEGKR